MEADFDLDKVVARANDFYRTHSAEWEFSQMFGEEDDPSSESDSGSGGEGTTSFLIRRPLPPTEFLLHLSYHLFLNVSLSFPLRISLSSR